MTCGTKPIRLSAHFDSLLRNLYVQFRIPRDQYKKRPEDLTLFTDRWNSLSGRSDTGAELIRYIQNQQKAKQRLAVPWPTFDGAHRRAPAMAGLLDDDQMQALRRAYEDIVLPLDLGTDAIVWEEEVLQELERRFSEETSRIVPGITLAAIAEEKRKRGLWCKVGRRARRSEMGFDDLDQIMDVG